ncbi:MAG: hypothetical protein IJS05_06115 [Paludibacteraceae bacterium]|nr:hypothetical protein [Paludibacteraceae bacterium]
MEQQVFTFIVLLIFAALIGWLGSKRNIGFGWAFAASIFLSPIIGLIITLCSKKKDVEFEDVERK